MFIRAYLRASTKEQNAERARESLIQFATQHGQRIAAFYIENVS
ncbi:recombinase family protein, partial [Salmonella enterica subsp. enterica serovar Mbandaka]|nr:recombinase family protein [Salmonella enterica subsp. enterica serovar Mbandaka]